MKLWKIHAMEDKFPGLWQQFFRHQCVAVGWAPYWKHHLRGETRGDNGWTRGRSQLLQVAKGDFVVVALKNHRVSRLGQVTELHIEDKEWDPLVPKSREHPPGQMGRRIEVRWDLTCGPDNRALVVELPESARFTTAELLPAISQIHSRTIDQLRTAMSDPANWVGLVDHFKYEKALSDYIAAYPHHLEDGLVQYPNAKIREKVFSDRKRLDVLLLDRSQRPVIVECKQGSPTPENLEQLRGYMKQLQKETGRKDVRGILVHGGSRKLGRDVIQAASQSPRVEVVQYRLHVDFV
jgi:hypothetical protein